MKYRSIIVPFSAGENDEQSLTLDELNNLAAGQLAGGGDPNTDENPEPEPATDNDEPEAGSSVENPANPIDQGAKPKPTADEKQQYAFAQQRHEITELTELLKTMADANGIKYESKADLVAKLKDKALVERATQQNVPVELLREVEQLRADSNQWKRYQHEQAAMTGFNKVATEFGLDQAGLEAFAVELDQAGKNPFTSEVDVLAEYKSRHLDEIVARKVQAAVEAALKGDAQASAQSSTPSQQQGSGDGGTEKITTIAQLNALLRR